MSVFNSRLSTTGASVGLRFNGEPVVVIDEDDNRTDAMGLIVLDEPIRTNDKYQTVILEGRVQFLSSDRSVLAGDDREPLRIEFRGYTWFVTDVSVDHAGFFEMFIRAEMSDNAMAIDLEGNQHRYG